MSALPKFYRAQEVADALGIATYSLYQILKRPGAPKPARLSDSPTAQMRFTDDDVAALITFLRPTPVPDRRRRRRTPSG